MEQRNEFSEISSASEPSNNSGLSKNRELEANTQLAFGNLSLGVSLGYNKKSGNEVVQLSADRYRHMLILGATGTGKSNHIQQMEREDIRNGAGVFILAAHEEDALYPLSCVPEERVGDVVFFDASNPEYLPCMNPLDVDTSDYTKLDKIIQDILELVTMDSHFEWAGPRFENYLRNGVGLLLQSESPYTYCIGDLTKLFATGGYERVKKPLESCEDENIRHFWREVFPSAQRSPDAGQVNDWFLAKFGRFCSDKTLKHIFGPGKQTINMQAVVDEGKIFIAYVPESRLGSATARTISKWLIMQLRDAILNRRSHTGGWAGLNYSLYEQDVNDTRDLQGEFCSGLSCDGGFDPFFVYVDEFARFASTDFERLLAESRKQHVGFMLATQTLAQTQVFDVKSGQQSKLEEAVLGNIASIMCYPMGVKDAELLARHFDVDENRLKHIKRYRPLASLSMDNQRCNLEELMVGVRPTPDNPSVPRRVAHKMFAEGRWTEVQGAPNKGAFREMLGIPEGDSCDERGGSSAAAADVQGEFAGTRAVEADANDERSDYSCKKSFPDAPQNGIGIAYRYRDPKTGKDVWAADVASAFFAVCTSKNPDEDYEAVWVIYADGEVKRLATKDEYQRELKRRIVRRITSGLSDEVRAEYDAIYDMDEAHAWLQEHRPDYVAIARYTIKEMKRAVVRG